MTDFRTFLHTMVRMRIFWICMLLNVILFIREVVLPPVVAKSPFAVVEDWGDFWSFFFVHFLPSLF